MQISIEFWNKNMGEELIEVGLFIDSWTATSLATEVHGKVQKNIFFYF